MSFYSPPTIRVNDELFKYAERKLDDFLLLGDLNEHLIPYSKDFNESERIIQNFILNGNSIILNDTS